MDIKKITNKVVDIIFKQFSSIQETIELKTREPRNDYNTTAGGFEGNESRITTTVQSLRVSADFVDGNFIPNVQLAGDATQISAMLFLVRAKDITIPPTKDTIVTRVADNETWKPVKIELYPGDALYAIHIRGAK